MARPPGAHTDTLVVLLYEGSGGDEGSCTDMYNIWPLQLKKLWIPRPKLFKTDVPGLWNLKCINNKLMTSLYFSELRKLKSKSAQTFFYTG